VSKPSPPYNLLYTITTKSSPQTITFSSESPHLCAVGFRDNSIRLIDTSLLLPASDDLDQITLKLYQDHYGLINDLKFSPNGKFLASASEDTTIRLFSLSTTSASKRSLRMLGVHNKIILYFLFSF